ncbi:Retrovirus-related Pol polyprotein from transposon 17.6 [Trichinella papuae]|uniref:Retrovirus-related Pol polyprotein from transposon 17.6 n=1 Tax=Trichinella papuae TaxID=268474 RepID=A0A0V1M6E4_9BILA|nr:Retrovirus-related Pol polyprotein from transposon 17.6 [Trichinella papuae]
MDYCCLNSVVVEDAQPYLGIDDTLKTLSFPNDLASAYYQVELCYADKEKTTFTSTCNLFQLQVILFKLCNASATFLCLLKCLFHLDDVIIFCQSVKQQSAEFFNAWADGASVHLQCPTDLIRFIGLAYCYSKIFNG